VAETSFLSQGSPVRWRRCGQHDVVALAPLGDHLGDELGRILEVDIHHDDRLAAGILQAGQRGHGLAEAAGEFQQLDAFVGAAVLQNDVLGAVGEGSSEKITS
jgi:hypothetical protein